MDPGGREEVFERREEPVSFQRGRRRERLVRAGKEERGYSAANDHSLSAMADTKLSTQTTRAAFRCTSARFFEAHKPSVLLPFLDSL
jgi:hypothetical protein